MISTSSNPYKEVRSRNVHQQDARNDQADLIINENEKCLTEAPASTTQLSFQFDNDKKADGLENNGQMAPRPFNPYQNIKETYNNANLDDKTANVSS